MRRKIYRAVRNLGLRYQIGRTSRRIQRVEDEIDNNNGAIPEFGYVSREFSLALSIKIIILEKKRKDSINKRNKLEDQLLSP